MRAYWMKREGGERAEGAREGRREEEEVHLGASLWPKRAASSPS